MEENVERLGTINNINNLYEDTYKTMFLQKCADYSELQQLYDYEVKKNEELKEQLEILKILIEDKEIIDKMNAYIEVRNKRIAKVISKYKKV